ncbi:MAG: metallophosphoesterase [Phycisphaerae bacterium]
MRIGILSDSHGDAETTRRAVDVLLAEGCTYLVHCGDVCGDHVLDHLAGTQAAFVFGNNDFDHARTAGYAHDLGVQCLDEFGTLDLAGKRIAVTHGDNPLLVRRLIKEQACDYLLTGHTHLPHDRRDGRVRWINPGALYRTRRKTVAVLDLSDDKLRVLQVGPGEIR